MYHQPNLTPRGVKMRQKEERLKRRGTTEEEGRREKGRRCGWVNHNIIVIAQMFWFASPKWELGGRAAHHREHGDHREELFGMCTAENAELVGCVRF